MADDADADLSADLDSGSAGKKGGGKGLIAGALKWILIAVAAVILIVTIVVITTLILNRNNKPQSTIPVSEEYVSDLLHSITFFENADHFLIKITHIDNVHKK